MKRIFLSSGVVLCMLCPAFATDPTGIPANNGVAYNDPTNNCIESVLGVSSGATSLQAQWVSVVSGAITLDSGYYATSSTATATQAATTAAAPTPLYSAYNLGMYSSSANATSDANANVTTNAINAITTAPAITGVAGYTFTFQGFYTDKAGTGTKVINADKSFTADAKTQISATGGTDVWYAHWTRTAHSGTITYSCGTKPTGATTDIEGEAPAAPNSGTWTYDAQFTLATTPGTCALNGYTFAGWECSYNLSTGVQNTTNAITYPATNGTITTAPTGTYHVNVNNAAITCAARWTPNVITIGWNDNGATTPSSGGGGTCTYDSAIVLPTEPARIGYTFNGWKVRNNS